MGPGYISSTVVVVANIALAATLKTTTDLPYPLTAAADIDDLVFATSNPIRTVVTVNSNRVDVLAADEQDVPKVIEKLRELCAGPFASLYPEICEHFEDGGSGENLDLDGIDPIIWWPPEDPTPHIITTTSTGEGESSSEPPSPVTSSPTLAGETGSLAIPQGTSLITSSDTISSDLSDSASDTSSPLLVTLTVPTEIKTTKTFEVVISEVPETGLSAQPTGVRGETADNSEAEHSTAIETDIKSTPAASGNGSADTAGTTTSKGEFNAEITSTSTLDEPERPAPLTTSTAQSQETLVTLSTDVVSQQPTGTTETTPSLNESESHVSTTTTSGSSEELSPTTDKPPQPEISLECPWKDDDDDEGPGPCTVVTIWHTSVIHYDITSTLTRDPKFRPVFEPTASPRPSRTRTSFNITLADPPTTDTEEPTTTPLWFTAFAGCTQTVKLLKKLEANPLTSTIYASTVTSTAFISCSCPNLATEHIGGYGLAVMPRTTTTILASTTKKVIRCEPSSLPGTA